MTITSPGRLLAWVVAAAASAAAVLAPQMHAVNTASAQEQPVLTADRQVTEIELTAAPLKWEIQPGLSVDGWGFNNQVPGPELRVREGDLVRVKLHNRLPAPTTIHWHGIDVPLNRDGVPGLSQLPVEPGADFTYEFVATNPGTRGTTATSMARASSSWGCTAMIVEPRDSEPVKYDREFTYVLDETALDFTPAVAMGRRPDPSSRLGQRARRRAAIRPVPVQRQGW